MMRSRLVLPEPEGPRSATSSPSGTLRLTSFERGEGAERLGDAADLDAHAPSRHSTRLLATRVTRASSASSEATAKAAWNWYSL